MVSVGTFDSVTVGIEDQFLAKSECFDPWWLNTLFLKEGYNRCGPAVRESIVLFTCPLGICMSTNIKGGRLESIETPYQFTEILDELWP